MSAGALLDAINRAFQHEQRLPRMVFREHVPHFQYRFADSAVVTSEGLGGALATWAAVAGDSEVLGAAVDLLDAPNASAGRWLRSDPGTVDQALQAWLSSTHTETSTPLFILARTLAFTGTSSSWGLWVEQDRELAVLGARPELLEDLLPCAAGLAEWVSADQVRELLSPSYHPDDVPESFTEALLRNY